MLLEGLSGACAAMNTALQGGKSSLIYQTAVFVIGLIDGDEESFALVGGLTDFDLNRSAVNSCCIF